MASEAKSTKATTKADTAPKKEATAAPALAAAEASPAKSADAAPSSYSRGEGQKAVTQAYKDNWNAIFAKKKSAPKTARKKKR